MKPASDSHSSRTRDDEEAAEEDEADLLEPWPGFLTRTARLAEEMLEEAGQEEGLDTWHRRQWR